jgi:hypothetical protein
MQLKNFLEVLSVFALFVFVKNVARRTLHMQGHSHTTASTGCRRVYQFSENRLNRLNERKLRLLPAGGFDVFLGAGDANHLGLIQNWRQLF